MLEISFPYRKMNKKQYFHLDNYNTLLYITPEYKNKIFNKSRYIYNTVNDIIKMISYFFHTYFTILILHVSHSS